MNSLSQGLGNGFLNCHYDFKPKIYFKIPLPRLPFVPPEKGRELLMLQSSGNAGGLEVMAAAWSGRRATVMGSLTCGGALELWDLAWGVAAPQLIFRGRCGGLQPL